MSDHHSFMKMLGMVGPEASKEESSSGTLSETKKPDTMSATEWDFGENRGEAHESPNSIEEKAKDFDAGSEGWAEEAIEKIEKTERYGTGNLEDEKTQKSVVASEPSRVGFTEANAIAEELMVRPPSAGEEDPVVVEDSYPSVTEEKTDQIAESLLSEVSRTPIIERTSTEKLEKNSDEIEEKTDAYTEQENAQITEEAVKERTLSLLVEASQMGRSKSIRLGQEQAERSQRTGGTVPFEYQEPERDNKTAHFSYDDEGGDCRLVLLEGQANTKAIHLNQLPIHIGRDPKNELALDDVNVSRFHAELREIDGAIGVVDLGSTNGVKVNGQMVTQQVLNTHDVIQIGDCLLEFLPKGVLSKGVPQSGALQSQSTASGQKKHRKGRLVFVLCFVGIVAGTFLGLDWWNRKGADSAKNLSVKIASDLVISEVEQIRGQMETQLQKKISDLPDNEIKKVFISRLEGSKLASLLPVQLKENWEKIPPPIFKMFLADPRMITEVVERGANFHAIDYVLRSRLNSLIESRRFAEALTLSEYLLSATPTDQSLKGAVDQLKKAVGKDSEGGVSKGYANLSEGEKKFYEYLDVYDRSYEELILQNRFGQAVGFAKDVRQKLEQLLKLDPTFERVAQPEIERWDKRSAQAESKLLGQQKLKESDEAERAKIKTEIREIRLHLDLGEVAQARAKIEAFLSQHPQDENRDQVVTFKRELEQGVSQSFAATKSSVDRLVKTESYENAWKELYRFLDVVPNHVEALELRDSIERTTRPRAAQFYNQARVYEFEADDLVAAEQYYKRAMEVADPRSELAKKAGRRYVDVKRKTIR